MRSSGLEVVERLEPVAILFYLYYREPQMILRLLRCNSVLLLLNRIPKPARRNPQPFLFWALRFCVYSAVESVDKASGPAYWVKGRAKSCEHQPLGPLNPTPNF